MAGIDVNWSGLTKVAEVSLAFGVGIVVIFALGVLGLARMESARSEGVSSSARTSGLVQAGAAFLVCAAGAVYGLYLIIPQFHK